MSRQPLSQEIKFRIPLPFAIPIGALLVIGGGTFGLSRILLSVPKEAAVVIALAVATNLLIAAAVVANRPDTARAAWPELVIVFLYPILIGIVLAQLDIGEGNAAAEGAGAQEASEQAAGGSGLNISAQDLQFSTDELTLPAGEEAEIAFANEDASSIQHNVALYSEEGGDEIFKGDVIPGGQSTTYAVPALEKGEASYFQCDIHPGMNGTVTIE